MFFKLLKHHFQSVKKALTPLSYGALLMASVGYFLMLFAVSAAKIYKNNTLSTIFTIVIASIIVLLVAYGLGSTVYLNFHFYKAEFANSEYLTHLRSASPHQILLSNILNIIIWNAILFTVFCVSVLIVLTPLIFHVHLQFNYLATLKTEAEYIAANTDWKMLILPLIGYWAYGLILPLLSITLGSLWAKKFKLLAALGIGYVINLSVNFIISLVTVLERSGKLGIPSNPYSVASLISASFLIILSVFGYAIMQKTLQNKQK